MRSFAYLKLLVLTQTLRHAETPAKAIAGRNFAQHTGRSFVTEQATQEQTKACVGYVVLLGKSFDLPGSGTGLESISHLHPGLPTDDQAAAP